MKMPCSSAISTMLWMMTLGVPILTMAKDKSPIEDNGRLIIESYIYSGRKDPPPLVLSGTEIITQVTNALTNLPKAEVDTPGPYIPGFRIRGDSIPHFPHEVWIGMGFVAVKNKEGGDIAYKQDLNNVAMILSRAMETQGIRVLEGRMAGASPEFAVAMMKEHAKIVEMATAPDPKLLLKEDLSVRLRVLALVACANMGRNDILPVARMIAQTGETVNVRRQAIVVIRKLGSLEDVGLLESLAEDSDRGVARDAKSAISIVRDRFSESKNK